MKISGTIWAAIAVLTGMFIAGVCFYPFLPERMATHWSGGSEPDGFMHKFAGTFPPLLIFVITVSLMAAPAFMAAKMQSAIFRKTFERMTLATALFLFYSYLCMLSYNVGVGINVSKLMAWAAAVFIVVLIAGIFLACLEYKREKPLGGIEKAVISVGPRTYADRLVEIAGDRIILRNYYFPFGDKSVKLADIKYIEAKEPTLWNGKWRLHGSGSIRTWFAADYHRPGRDKIFVAHIKGRWWRIGFTVEDSIALTEVLAGCGVTVRS